MQVYNLLTGKWFRAGDKLTQKNESSVSWLGRQMVRFEGRDTNPL